MCYLFDREQMSLQVLYLIFYAILFNCELSDLWQPSQNVSELVTNKNRMMASYDGGSHAARWKFDV